MNRPRVILSLFGICLAIVLSAMTWVSVVVIQLDRRDATAQRQAEVQESARLALWRMDSALGPILAREDTRPRQDYQAFYSPPWAFDAQFQPQLAGRVVLPSPLLVQSTPFVRLHFQIGPDGRMTSPQVPETEVPPDIEEQLVTIAHLASALADFRTLAGSLDRDALLAVAPHPATGQGQAGLPVAGFRVGAAESVAQSSQVLLNELNASNEQRQSELPLDRKQVGRARNAPDQQQLRSNMEYQQRVESSLQNSMINKINRFLNKASQQPQASGKESRSRQGYDPAPPSDAPQEGDLKPVWMDGRLLLVRQVRVGEEVLLQGCWLDWESLRPWLLQRVTDLLPDARLLPVEGPLAEAREGTPHLLAALPAQFVPGIVNGRTEALSFPIRSSLLVAWSCTLLASLAVTVLVLGMVALSERRAAFVSAVTHELRTPLTTFRMYTEMLLGGMVADEKRRNEYLATLSREADRLAQLVENVLSYARLERNRAAMHREDTTAGAMVERFAERLRQRAAQAGMELTITVLDTTGEMPVRTDVSAVEQIVFNLVDNACKYAATADDRRIHVVLQSERGRLRISVTDHGPGVAADVTRRLFSPFGKSAKAAANSAQGVGLGLALSRRLARRLGGNLQLLHSDGNGCRFELALPVKG